MDNHQSCNNLDTPPSPKNGPGMATEDSNEKECPVQPKNPETSSSSNNTIGGELNLCFVPDEKRRVSIASEALQADKERRRTLSGGSHDSRYKSILVNGDGFKLHSDGDQKLDIPRNEHEGVRRFTYESIENLHDVRNSWWYGLCESCRRKETGAGWEPSFWSSACPYPFCPTYRHVSRIIALIFLGILAWGIVYTIVGKDVAPGGQLFDIAMLCIWGYFGGWVFRMINLPALVGMLVVGIIYQNLGLINIHGPYDEFASILRKIALVLILSRAGLDLDPGAVRRLFWTVLRMGLLPWLSEFILLACLTHYFLGFPWIWGMLLGSIVAAVAPAVVVPCLVRLRNKGYGVAKGIPTLVIAVSGIDDAASVAAYGIISGIIFSENSVTYDILMGPLAIFIGILYGFLWGFVARYIPEKKDPFAGPLRILLLLGSGLIAILGSESIEMAGAGPLGVITAAFMSMYVWSKQGWDIEDNPVAVAYEIFWTIFEPVLFSLTGTQIKLKEIDPKMFGISAAILVTTTVVRIGVTLIVGYRSTLNTKEKFFVSLAWMSKASVQAALGPIALFLLRDQQGTPEYHYAELLLVMCTASIILTAPLGAVIATLSASKMLQKTTTIVQPPQGWRKTHRPSLRDIQLTEEDEDENDENDSDEKLKPTSGPPNEKIRPSVVITSQP